MRFLKLLSFFLITHILFIGYTAYAQTVSIRALSAQRPAWQYSLSGTLSIGIQETSFGFVCAADDRFLYGFTDTGTLLWKSSVSGKIESLTVTQDDFVYTISRSSQASLISLYNSSGLLLWSVTHHDKILYPITIGRDGRIFVMSPASLTAYNIHGKPLWNIPLEKTPPQNIYPFNDGSLLVFQTETGAIRILHDGTIRDNVTFIEPLTAIESTPAGIICAFESGVIQCYAMENNTKKTRWTTDILPARTQLLTYGNGHVIALDENGYVTSYDVTNGNIQWTLFDEVLLQDMSFSVYYTNDIFYITTATYIAGYTISGTIQWQRSLTSSSDFMQYTKNGYLIRGTSDWILHAYRLHNPLQYFVEPTVRQYSLFDSLEQDKIDSLRTIIDNTPQRYSLLVANSAITQLAILGSLQYQQILCHIALSHTESTLKNTAIRALGILAFDPEAQALNTIQHYIQNTASRESAFLITICDAVYNICRFMGKPVILKQGRDILLTLMSKQYGNIVNNYASNTFQKLAALF